MDVQVNDKEQVKDNDRIREVLGILMDSPLYLELSLPERYELLLRTLHRL